MWEIHAFNSLITLPSQSTIGPGNFNRIGELNDFTTKELSQNPLQLATPCLCHSSFSSPNITNGVYFRKNSTEKLHVTRRLSAWQRRSLVISRGLGLAPSRSMACSPTRLESPQFDAEFGTAWEMNLQNYLQHKAKLTNLFCTRIFHGRCFGMVADCWDGSFLLGGDS